MSRFAMSTKVLLVLATAMLQGACVDAFSSGGVQFTKVSRKHCKGRTVGHHYNSLHAARAACARTSACSGVYDSSCDGRAPYYMCKAGITLHRSSSSCVYTKKGSGKTSCSVFNRCNEFQGDCDVSGQCLGSLKCGSNNCGAHYKSSDDCCYNPKKHNYDERPGSSSSGFSKHSKKHCSGQTTGSSYHSLRAAENACASTSRCTGVYDSRCDNKGSFYMCATSHFSRSSHSCVYVQKGRQHKKTWTSKMCIKVVKRLKKEIAKKGCSMARKLMSEACLAAGGGPEDPVADVCVGLVIAYCPAILKKLMNHVASNAELCAGCTSCSVLDQCSEYQGDCDFSSQCRGSLECGTANCGYQYTNKQDDCCYNPRTHKNSQRPGGGSSSSSCRDSSSTGYSSHGRPMSCKQLRGYCRSSNYGKTIRAKCPATCNMCSGH